jgi:hypothetical protein
MSGAIMGQSGMRVNQLRDPAGIMPKGLELGSRPFGKRDRAPVTQSCHSALQNCRTKLDEKIPYCAKIKFRDCGNCHIPDLRGVK